MIHNQLVFWMTWIITETENYQTLESTDPREFGRNFLIISAFDTNPRQT